MVTVKSVLRIHSFFVVLPFNEKGFGFWVKFFGQRFLTEVNVSLLQDVIEVIVKLNYYIYGCDKKLNLVPGFD